MSANEPLPKYGVDTDFPILWKMAHEYDMAERLGGSTSEMHAEIDRALRELWDARRSLPAYDGSVGSVHTDARDGQTRDQNWPEDA